MNLESGFFWDAILATSQAAHHFYDTGMGSLILPAEIDAGHPPFTAWLLAGMWKTFGRTLLVSHLFAWPLAMLCCYQTLAFFRQQGLSPVQITIASIIALSEPCFFAQTANITAELMLYVGALYLLRFIVRGLSSAPTSAQHIFSLLAVAALVLSSSRGTVMFAGFAASCIAIPLTQNRDKSFKQAIYQSIGRNALWLIGGVVVTLTWNAYHYLQTGWVGYNKDSQWAYNYALTDARGMARNIAIALWRLLDHGRIIALLMIVYLWRNFSKPLKQTLLFAFVPVLMVAALMIPYNNPIGHRYLGLAYMGMYWVLGSHIFKTSMPDFKRYTLLAMLFMANVLGPWIPYPEGVARGWDATYISYPYHQLRREALAHLRQQGIPLRAVASEFPNLEPDRYINLSSDTTHCRAYTPGDTTQHYLLYSNIFNSLEPADFKHLPVLYHAEQGAIMVVVYGMR